MSGRNVLRARKNDAQNKITAAGIYACHPIYVVLTVNYFTLGAMTPEERDKLVAAYIQRYAERIVRDKDNVFVEQDLNWWAEETFQNLGHKDPELVWELVLQVIGSTDKPDVLGMLAAGPLEDLVNYHGPQFIDRIEERAKRDEKFRDVLYGVWPSSTSPIRERFEKACGA
jgi:hypothetical protein